MVRNPLTDPASSAASEISHNHTDCCILMQAALSLREEGCAISTPTNGVEESDSDFQLSTLPLADCFYLPV